MPKAQENQKTNTALSQSGVERFVIRFDQDVLLSVLHKELLNLHKTAIPLRWEIRGKAVEFFYAKDTQEAMDFYKEEIRKRKLELATPVTVDVVGV